MPNPAIQHPNDANPRNNIHTHRIPQKPKTKTKLKIGFYRMQTRPIIEYYQERYVLITVDGNRSIEEVSKSIGKLLEGIKSDRPREKH